MSKWVLVVPHLLGDEGEEMEFTPISVHASLQDAMTSVKARQSIYCNSIAYLYECDKPPIVVNHVDGKFFFQ